MSVFDLYNDAQNTVIVNAAVDAVLNQQQRIASQFAPVVDTQADRIKRGGIKIRALGMAPLVSDDATPPIYRPRLQFTEEFVELVKIEEMTPIEESLLRKLQISGDDQVSIDERNRAGADILTRAKALQIRNENRSDWLVMQAILTGKISAQLADDSSQYVELSYDYDPTHLPVLTGTSRWTQTSTSVPISDLVAWQELLADDSGELGIHIWLNTNTWRLIRNSVSVETVLAGPNGQYTVPTPALVSNLLDEPDSVVWHIVDAGWYPESAGFDIIGRNKRTKWIPDNTVVMTTALPYQGENIATNWNGLVAKVTDWNQISHLQGPQSKVTIDQDAEVTRWRQVSRRLPDIHHPEAILVATVG